MKKTTFQLHDICNILAVDEDTVKTVLERKKIYPYNVIVRDGKKPYIKSYYSKEQVETIKTLKI